MAWDDTQADGMTLFAAMWNAMVADQKTHAFRHKAAGIDPITYDDVGAASSDHIHTSIDGGTS